MITPFAIPPRQRPVIGVMEPIKSLCKGDISRLTPESKITGKKSLRLVRSPLIYVPMTPRIDGSYPFSINT